MKLHTMKLLLMKVLKAKALTGRLFPGVKAKYICVHLYFVPPSMCEGGAAGQTSPPKPAFNGSDANPFNTCPLFGLKTERSPHVHGNAAKKNGVRKHPT